MIKEFNELQEIEEYYDENTNTYVFKENGEYIDLIKFNFDLDVDDCNIDACDIKAYDIKARDIKANDIVAEDINARDITAKDIKALDIRADDNIKANDIKARDIKAWHNVHAKNIEYYAVCYARHDIKCKTIKGKTPNSKHFSLEGKIEVEVL